MNEQERNNCPDCDALDGVGRRDFLMAVGGTAVTLAGLDLMPTQSIPHQAPAQSRCPGQTDGTHRKAGRGSHQGTLPGTE